MSNINDSMPKYIFINRNDNESLVDIIAWTQIEANGTHLNNIISIPSTENNFSAISEPSSMDNSMIWTIICDMLGVPCSIAFLYVLYRGIEVLVICKNLITPN